MAANAIDECIRYKRYLEAASLVVKNYKLRPQLTKHIAIKLKEHHMRKLQYLRETGRSFLDIAQEAHLQTLEELSWEGLLVNTLKTDISLSEQLGDEET